MPAIPGLSSLIGRPNVVKEKGALRCAFPFQSHVVTIAAHASTEGKLYGSVGPRDIAEAFTAAGLELHKSEVILGEGAFRNVGEFDVIVKLHADVETTVKVIVEADA